MYSQLYVVSVLKIKDHFVKNVTLEASCIYRQYTARNVTRFRNTAQNPKHFISDDSVMIVTSYKIPALVLVVKMQFHSIIASENKEVLTNRIIHLIWKIYQLHTTRSERFTSSVLTIGAFMMSVVKNSISLSLTPSPFISARALFVL